jgi:hypothetical protein
MTNLTWDSDKMKKKILFLSCFFLCVCIISVDSRSEAGVDERKNWNVDIPDILMRNYCFTDYSTTSGILTIDIKDVQSDYRGYCYCYSTFMFYTKVKIWWPDRGNICINLDRILKEAVYPAIETGGGSNYKQNKMLDKKGKKVYLQYLNMKGIPEPWFYDLDAYIDIMNQVLIDHPGKDNMQYLVESQKVSFQDLSVNELILLNISKMYPEAKKPLGVHLEYWQDPSCWNIW